MITTRIQQIIDKDYQFYIPCSDDLYQTIKDNYYARPECTGWMSFNLWLGDEGINIKTIVDNVEKTHQKFLISYVSHEHITAFLLKNM